MTILKILHFHTFKNGGSTFDWILKRNFGNKFAEFHGPKAESSLLEADALEYFENYPEIVAITSHHLRFPIRHCSKGLRLIPISFIRNPIDRIYSVYAHKQREKALANLPSEPFKYWLASSIDERPYSVRDVQTNIYSDGGTYYEVPDIGTFKRACRFIDELEFCGIVEEYDTSMVWLEEILSKHGLNFDASYRRQNINPERAQGLQERVDEIKEQLGTSLYNQLLINNAYDLELYEYALKKMQAQTSKIVDLNMKISSLQKRSVNLRVNQ